MMYTCVQYTKYNLYNTFNSLYEFFSSNVRRAMIKISMRSANPSDNNVYADIAVYVIAEIYARSPGRAYARCNIEYIYGI